MPHATESFQLLAGQTAALHPRSRRLLQVVRGRLWVTCSHDLTDHFVAAGTSLHIGPGRVVLEADAGPALYRWAPDTVPGHPRPHKAAVATTSIFQPG